MKQDEVELLARISQRTPVRVRMIRKVSTFNPTSVNNAEKFLLEKKLYPFTCVKRKDDIFRKRKNMFS